MWRAVSFKRHYSTQQLAFRPRHILINVNFYASGCILRFTATGAKDAKTKERRERWVFDRRSLIEEYEYSSTHFYQITHLPDLVTRNSVLSSCHEDFSHQHVGSVRQTRS